jgi:hypothetical protein
MKLILSDSDEHDPDSLDRDVRRLRAEMLRLDVQAVTTPTVPGPDGARGVDVVQLGALLVTLVPSAEVLGYVFDLVKTWLNGRSSRSITVEIDGDVIEVTGATRADIGRLVEVFAARHGVTDAIDS